jgi:two-component system, chemotaxis family, chemotaxis protein CheV
MNPAKAAVLLESDTNELEIVEFRVDGLDSNGEIVPCYYGVNVAKVREIIRIPQVWKSLNRQPAVAGMIKVRDRVLPVIDLAELLHKKCEQLQADRVIILEFNRLTVGVLVHSVSRIYRISWEQVESPAKTVHSNQVTGLVKMDDRIILVLDFERIVGELCHEYALPDADDVTVAPVDNTFERSKKTLVVADDSPFIRNTICTALRTAGYPILEASNGEEAWQIISCQIDTANANEAPISDFLSLVITDVEMPRMDGLHLTSKIKKHGKLLQIPVIIFSSMASDDNIRKWLTLGADVILTKPDLSDLVQVTDKLLLNASQ